MAETSSIVQAVDDYIGQDLDVSAALQNLFNSQPTTEYNTTPSRTLQSLNRQVFSELLAVIVAYGLDLNYVDYLQAWTEPIYDQLREELTQGAAISELHYHESIPLLRMYKAYVTIVEGLQISPHPLEIAITNHNLSFSPALQEELRHSILDALSSACKFRQLHEEFISRDSEAWAALGAAETKAASMLVADSDEMEQRLGSADSIDQDERTIIFEQLGNEELQSQCLQLQAEKEELIRNLKNNKATDGKLEAEIRRLDDKLRPLSDRIKDMEKQIKLRSDEIERSVNAAVVTLEDVERKKDELNMLQQRENNFYAELAALDEKINVARHDVQSATDLLNEGLRPLTKYVVEEVVPTTSAYSASSHEAARLSADRSCEDVDYQTARSARERELGDIDSTINRMRAQIQQAENELDQLRESNQELRSDDHRKKIAMKDLRLQELNVAATSVMKQQRELKSKFLNQKTAAEKMLAECDAFLQRIEKEQTTYAQRNATALSSVVKNITDQLTELT